MKRPSVLRYALLFLLFYCGLGWAAAAVSSTSNTSNTSNTLNTPSAQVLRQQLGAIALSLDEADDGRAQLAGGAGDQDDGAVCTHTGSLPRWAA